MATTYNSTSVGTISGEHWGQAVVGFAGTVLIPASTTFAQNDIINLCIIPANSMMVGCWITLPDMESSSTNLVLTLEDDVASPNVFLGSISTGQAGGIIRISDFTANYQYVNQQMFRFLVATGGGSATAASVTKIQFAVSFARNYFASPT